MDGVGCGCFVGGKDGEIVGEEGVMVDVEEAGTGRVGGGRFDWIYGGGGLVGEVVLSMRGLVRDGRWFGGRERLLGGIHFGIWKE